MKDLNLTSIVPTFNRSQELSQCLLAFSSVKIHNHSVHVFDNASDHAHLKINQQEVSKYGCVQYTLRPENIGGLRNFLVSARSVNSDYIHFMSDDNIIFPMGLKEIWEKVLSNPCYGAYAGVTVCSNEEYNLKSTRPLCKNIYASHQSEDIIAFLLENTLIWDSVIFKRSALISAIEQLEPSIYQNYAADLALILEVSVFAGLYFTPSKISMYRHHAQNASNVSRDQDNAIAMYTDRLGIFDQMSYHTVDKRLLRIIALRKQQFSHSLLLGFLKDEQFIAYIVFLRKAFAPIPSGPRIIVYTIIYCAIYLATLIRPLRPLISFVSSSLWLCRHKINSI